MHCVICVYHVWYTFSDAHKSIQFSGGPQTPVSCFYFASVYSNMDHSISLQPKFRHDLSYFDKIRYMCSVCGCVKPYKF